MLSILPLVTLLQAASATPPVVLDGGSMYPPKQTVAYHFTCPDGVVTVEVAQVHGSPPRLARALYDGVQITRRIGPQISEAIGRFRSVETVSPRCLTGGGIWLMFGGLLRDENPSSKHIVSVTFDRQGRLTSN